MKPGKSTEITTTRSTGASDEGKDSHVFTVHSRFNDRARNNYRAAKEVSDIDWVN